MSNEEWSSRLKPSPSPGASESSLSAASYYSSMPKTTSPSYSSYPSLELPYPLPPMNLYDHHHSTTYPSPSYQTLPPLSTYDHSPLHFTTTPTPPSSSGSGSSSPRDKALGGSSYALPSILHSTGYPSTTATAYRPYSNPRDHHNQWYSTCDPRDIPARQQLPPFDYAPPTTTTHALPPLPPPHHHSIPPLQHHNHHHDNNGKRIRSRGASEMAKSMLVGAGPSVHMSEVYAVKKRDDNVPQVLGMGLDDIDESELEFTSRQDTKPTRLLRRQCFNCKTWRDVSAWRRSVMAPGHIVCNKCGLYEKAHKRPRPLNERGEFVRPGKEFRAAVQHHPSTNTNANTTNFDVEKVKKAQA